MLALGGVVLKLSWMDAPAVLATGLYVALGWVALGAFPALVQAVPAAALLWFVAGGVVYTLGAVIFVLDRPWPGRVPLRCTLSGTCVSSAAAAAFSGPSSTHCVTGLRRTCSLLEHLQESC